MQHAARPARFSWMKTFGSFALAGGLLLAAASARATITITEVRNASNTLDLTGTTPTIFGGVAGDEGAGTCGSKTGDAVCSSCEAGGTGDARFVACNPARIYPTLELVIVLSSDTVDSGRPAITTDDDTIITPSVQPATVAKGQSGTLTVTWANVCDKVINSTVCTPSGTYSDTVKIGIDKDGDGKLNASGDESKTVTITVHPGFPLLGGQSIHQDCASTADSEGICEFDTSPGDEKVVVKDIQAASSFPQSDGIKFLNVLFFYSTTGFTDINPTSPYFGLEVESDDASSFVLKTDRLTGLENETKYYFKAAVQDQAMNIAYFTSDGLDKDCATDAPPCHTAKPGEVVGVLEDDVNCFVATAAFGSPMAFQVKMLREFRNQALLPYEAGRAFVRLYYSLGPVAARFIAKSEALRGTARVALTPALGFAWLSLKLGLLGALGVVVAILATPALVWQRRRRTRAS